MDIIYLYMIKKKTTTLSVTQFLKKLLSVQVNHFKKQDLQKVLWLLKDLFIIHLVCLKRLI